MYTLYWHSHIVAEGWRYGITDMVCIGDCPLYRELDIYKSMFSLIYISVNDRLISSKVVALSQCTATKTTKITAFRNIERNETTVFVAGSLRSQGLGAGS